MLLMIALYGLGAAGLELDEIKWRSGIIALRRPKTGVRFEPPLLPPVAKSLSTYLEDERPRFVETRRTLVITSKRAIRCQFKTNQRDGPKT